MKSNAIIVSVDMDWYGPAEVKIGGVLVGYRPYDGSSEEGILAEVYEGLAKLLNEKFGWPKEQEED